MEKNQNVKNRIINLNNQISLWDHHYFNLNESLVSDEEYDLALWELQSLKVKYPDFFINLENDATKRVGANLLQSSFEKVEHKFPMISLNKAHNWNDVVQFLNKLDKNIEVEHNLIVQPKIDGVSIALHYENGFLKTALTRGNGEVGENVTSNILAIKNIPHKIDYLNPVEIRGEIFMPISVFKNLNIEKNLNLANPRNAAAGAIRQKDSKISEERNLEGMFYEIVQPEKLNIFKQIDVLNFLKSNNFLIPKYEFFSQNEQEKLKKYLSNFDRFAFKEFQIDGLVIKLNEMQYYEKLGSTSKFAHSAIAYKFNAIVAITKLINIFPSVGRTGNITYNAVLEPVELNGTKVSAATLHNHEYIRDLNINIGDKVKVIKAGEIIPKVTSLAFPKDVIDYFLPSIFCPSCDSELKIFPELVDQFCVNENCFEKNIRAIQYFASKNCMNIETLANATIKKLWSNNFLTGIESLYKLKDKKEELLKIEGFAEKSINKILKQIELSKSLGLERILVSVGIRNIGNFSAKEITKFLEKFNLEKYENLINFNWEIFNGVKNFSTTTINDIKNYFEKKENRQLFKYFDEQNFVFIKKKKNISSKLLEKTFLITGSLSKSRNYFNNLILENGGKILNSVSSNLDYLLVGDSPGSKLDKAKEKSISIINEKDFFEMID